MDFLRFFVIIKDLEKLLAQPSNKNIASLVE